MVASNASMRGSARQVGSSRLDEFEAGMSLTFEALSVVADAAERGKSFLLKGLCMRSIQLNGYQPWLIDGERRRQLFVSVELVNPTFGIPRVAVCLPGTFECLGTPCKEPTSASASACRDWPSNSQSMTMPCRCSWVKNGGNSHFHDLEMHLVDGCYPLGF